MNQKVIKWAMSRLVRTIVATLLNKYDMFMVIEGGTGKGKSTLAYLLARDVSREFRRLYRLDVERLEYYYERVGVRLRMEPQDFIRKIMQLKEKGAYSFKPKYALVYTQDELLRALSSWNVISVPDEMINITFNRDFYSEKQKDIIKMVNMYRDHENLTIACVPSFANLDTQIRNLTKLKITVRKRGSAIVHTPNKIIYSKDKWDVATNEKIEKEWILKKVRSPNYSKLTTFRGICHFPPLSPREEMNYQKIKNFKRSLVLKNEMHIKVEEEDDPYKKFFKKLIDGGVRSYETLEGYAEGMGLTKSQLHSRIVKDLKAMNKPHHLSIYMWDKKKLKKDLSYVNFEAMSD